MPAPAIREPCAIQRYCASGNLDCVKAATALGDKYFVDPGSVARHIAQIEDLLPLNVRAAGRDASRQIAMPVAAPNQNDSERMRDTRSGDMSPIIATQNESFAIPQL